MHYLFFKKIEITLEYCKYLWLVALYFLKFGRFFKYVTEKIKRIIKIIE